MGSDEIHWMSALELIEAYGKKELSPVEVTDAILERIEAVNPPINAIVTLTADAAREQAKSSERAYAEGSAGRLEGVPITIKDLIPVKGVRTTFGSRLFEDYVPEADAVLVERIKAAGGVILGKTNVPEFGLVAVTDNLVFGPTWNPWDLKKTVGGSSGGAAAGLAAGLGPLAVGNDGGGSIRIPASLCGVAGLKPEFGRVPSWPHAVHGWETMNHEGPMARTVSDCALLLDVMAGSDERDRFSLPDSPTNYQRVASGKVDGLRVAFTSDLAAVTVDPEVAEIAKRAALAFARIGCDVEQDDPGIFDMSADLATLVIAETGAAHEHHLEEAAEKMFPPYRPFLELASVFTARDLARVGFHREDIWEKLWPFFETYDALLTPTAICPAFDLKPGGMISPEVVNGVEVGPANWIAYTFPFNFTGQPAMSIPCGFTAAGLPVGLQIVGRRFDEATVLRLAAAFEHAHPWNDKHPLE